MAQPHIRLALLIRTFSAPVGGAEGFAVSVMRRVAARGHEVHVIAETGDPVPGIQLHPTGAAGVEAVLAGLGEVLTIDWGLTHRAHIHRLGGGIHAEFARYNRLGRPWPVRAWKRFVEPWGVPKHRRQLALERGILADPKAHYIAVSDFVRAHLQNGADVPDTRIRVLRNGVDVERFGAELSAEERGQVRADMGLQPDDIAFLMVANNLRLKNYALLRDVFSSLSPQLPQIRLVVLGRGRILRRPTWLHCIGHTREPEKVYAAVDALLHPTYFDACANVVLEALAAGLPVVSSDLNGSAELIDHGRNGFVLPVAGAASSEILGQWCEVVSRLASESASGEEVGRAGRELAGRQSIEAYVDAFEEFLREVADKVGRGPLPGT